MSEPVSTGVATRMPNSVSFRLSIFLMGMPMIANIIHTAKHAVNASVLSVSTEICFWVWVAMMHPLPRLQDWFI